MKQGVVARRGVPMLAALLVLCGLLVSPSPAHAVACDLDCGSGPSFKAAGPAWTNEDDDSPASYGLQALKPYAQFSSSGLSIASAPQSVLDGIDATALSNEQAYIKEINDYVTSGAVILGADGFGYVNDGDPESPRPRCCVKVLNGGESTSHAFWRAHWYGYEVGLDSYAVNKIEGAASAGAAIAAGKVLFGGGAVAVAISAALWATQGVFQLCQHSNGWVYLHILRLTAPPAIVCNPFA